MTEAAIGSLRERRRQELLREVESVAMRAFAERGYDNVSIASICESAGISQSTFFRLFGSKDALVFAAIRQGSIRLGTYLAADPDRSGLLEPYLRALRAMFVDDGFDDAKLLSSMVPAIINPGVRSLFLDDIRDGDDPLDAELARRLGVPVSDPRVRSVRWLQWIAVDQALATLAPGQTLDDLIETVRASLRLLEGLTPHGDRREASRAIDT